MTDGSGASDLYLAADNGPPAEVPEPSTAALLGLALLAVLRGPRTGRAGARPLLVA